MILKSSELVVLIVVILILCIIYRSQMDKCHSTQMAARRMHEALALNAERRWFDARPVHMIVLLDQENPLLQMCSVYSTALHNPTRPINVYYFTDSDRQQLLINNTTTDNVLFHHIDMNRFCRKTPIEQFARIFINMATSNVRNQYLSNIYRLCLLYDYGGTFIDASSGLISIRRLPDRLRNAIGTMTNGQLTNVFIDFDNNHHKLSAFMSHIDSFYSGQHSNSSSIGQMAVEKYFGNQASMIDGIDRISAHRLYPIDSINVTLQRIFEHFDTFAVNIDDRLIDNVTIDYLFKSNCPNVRYNRQQ